MAYRSAWSKRKFRKEKPLIIDCQNPECGKDLEVSKYGRARRYCSDKCRKAAQRARDRGEQLNHLEQRLEARCKAFPAAVVAKLQSIKDTYGVHAAWESSEAIMLFVDPQHATS